MTAADSVSSRNRQIARSTALVMVAFGLAKAISLVQTVIIFQSLGIKAEMDAFASANRIPEQIFNLISGGALAHAFIPIFSGFLARDDTEGAWRTARHVVNAVFTLTLLVSLVVFVTAPWLVANVVAPGFDDTTHQQTVELMRILLVSTLIFSVSGISMGILQSHQRFLLPALAPVMFDVGILIGVVFLLKPYGVHGVAIGAVLGSALHFGIQVPGLIRVRARWWPDLDLKDPVLWRVVRLMLPRVAGLGVIGLNFLVMGNIASRLGTSSVAALDSGWRLMQIPETLIGTAMGTVIFPTLAALSELGDVNGKRDAMSGALRFILIATIPSAVGLIVVGRPLISLLEGGEFDAVASDLVYSTLRFFALGLIVHSTLEVVARSFYADKDTLTPLWAALGGAAINLVLAISLSDIIGVSGLALANSSGVAFEVIVLLWMLRRRWHGVNENLLARTTVKTLVASLVMALAVVLVDALWNALGLSGQGRAMTIVQVVVEVIVGAVVFLAAALAMKMHELRTLLALVLRRPTVLAEQGI